MNDEKYEEMLNELQEKYDSLMSEHLDLKRVHDNLKKEVRNCINNLELEL